MSNLSPEMREQIPPEPIFERIRNFGFPEEGQIAGMVPIDLVYQTDVPVESARVREIRDLFNQKNAAGRPHGQMAPVLLGHIPDLGYFPIIDGFHRAAVKYQDGATDIYSAITLNSTWEDIYKQRTIHAHDHDAVKLVRMLDWLPLEWQETPWSKIKDDKEITVIQAFDLYGNDGSGELLGLTKEQAEKIKEWVDKKIDEWGMAHGTIINYLRFAKIANPDIVRNARGQIGQKDPDTIPIMHAYDIAHALPLRSDMQSLVANFSMKNRLNRKLSQAVAKNVAKFKTIEEARKHINSPNYIEKLDEAMAGSSKRAKRKPAINREVKRTPDSDKNGIIVANEIDICNLALQNMLLKGDYLCLPYGPRERRYLSFKDKEAPSGVQRFGWGVDKIRDLEEKIGSYKEVAVVKMCEGRNASEEDALAIVDMAGKRIIADIKHGVLRYTGVFDVLPKLFVNCVDDEVKRRKKEAEGIAEKQPKGWIKPTVSIDLESYRELMIANSRKSRRREITLATAFDLTPFAIAQVIGIGEDIVRTNLAATATKLDTSE